MDEQMYKRLIYYWFYFLAFGHFSRRAVCLMSAAHYDRDGLGARDFHLPEDMDTSRAPAIVVDPKQGDSIMLICKRCGKPFLCAIPDRSYTGGNPF